MEGGGGGGHAREHKQACSLEPQLHHLGAQGFIRTLLWDGSEARAWWLWAEPAEMNRQERAGQLLTSFSHTASE